MKILTTIPSRQELLQSVFVYPTETCYGIGCDATNISLAWRIFQIKQRPANKPVLWLVKDIEMARQYAVFSPLALKLAQKFWPGPLSIVLPLKAATERGRKVAMRVSPHQTPGEVIKSLDRPLISTSANLSGAEDCYSADEVLDQFTGHELQPDFIIDGGTLPKRLPSTVIRIVGNELDIMRAGEITKDDLLRA